MYPGSPAAPRQQRRDLSLLFCVLCFMLLFMAGCKNKTDSLPVHPIEPTGVSGATGSTGVTLNSASLPIKVCCGSMSFYSASQWTAVPGHPDSFCTNVPADGQYSASVFEPVSERKKEAPVLLSGNWTVEVHSYAPTHGQLRIGKEGVALHTDAHGQCSPPPGTMALMIEPLRHEKPLQGHVGFYQDDGPAEGQWAFSRRFLDDAQYTGGSCAEDRDKCERIAAMVVGNVSEPCREAACMVYLNRTTASH